MDPLNLFVFGAGYTASAAIDAINASSVAATTRTPEKRAALTARGIDAHLFDGERPGPALSDALYAATHLLVSIAPGPGGDPVLARHAADLSAAPNLGWIGYYSTIGVYGDSGGVWIDETFPAEPLSPRNRHRLVAEAQWRDFAKARDIPLAILRLAGIYGPSRSPFDKLRAGTARRIVKPGQVFNRIHVADIAHITARAARTRLAGLYNLSDDEPAPPQDVIAHAARLLDVEPPPEIPFAEADLSPMARTFYAGNRRVSNAAVKSALGYRLLYPTYREGLAAILESERD